MKIMTLPSYLDWGLFDIYPMSALRLSALRLPPKTVIYL